VEPIQIPNRRGHTFEGDEKPLREAKIPGLVKIPSKYKIS
jgi:hypothetical protein